MPATNLPNLQTNVALAPYTTIHLGGPAKYFIDCTSVLELKSALDYAAQNRLPVHVLGGGSNTVFPESGYNGLVLRVNWQSIEFVADGKYTKVTASAGEPWDSLVFAAVSRGLGGLENMSGIPGTVGAAPIQNVGAYGQDVSQVITSVTAIDRSTQQESNFPNELCQFDYRTSRFKKDDQHKFVITNVTFRLSNEGIPSISHPDVLDELRNKAISGRGITALTQLRTAILNVRRRKSMIIDPADPHSCSCGSFFENPILTKTQYRLLEEKAGQPVPARPAGQSFIVSAAWLIEQAGFPKGYRQDSVGVSDHHNLALVNYGGTTAALLSLAEDIRSKVKDKFGILLETEPVIV
ncbi:MAG: UDP-N-acetylenolpyruvoylglucosamine reductase [Candidatus Andersenbacteria bacterium RIFCSPLOWO2_12_FULL_45_8]|nr:MAG: UDP-N-acetylenolpyruvoylglucosamine reductase [Candidatus Andersenbacteria bacterium RIFCSPHIGHO2_02_FULL_46_16]OGY38580.1 MAG: UDP-N-acetylenolpyruvoylglucosamine reductase [Candidatus Andersenbacteria bacterium RIFCSPLOWO2_12_FULL_45_8]